MKNYDEISLLYWRDHKRQIGSSKSYVCDHNGYIYGDGMTYSRFEYVYKDSDKEEVYRGKAEGPKGAYFEMVERACSNAVTLQNFQKSIADKFRIYTEAQVKQFSLKKRNSTRIRDDSCAIFVNGEKYYVANNLKVCEYFNSAAMSIDQGELDKWFIRIYCEDELEGAGKAHSNHTSSKSKENEKPENFDVEKDIESEQLTGKEKEAIVKIRLNQGKFRELLIDKYEKCCLCGIEEKRLLIASHIKPWSVSNPEEKIDRDNGLLLCPNHDKLFDEGFISFDEKGGILISKRISANDRALLNINYAMALHVNNKTLSYLEYHRNNIFVAQ